VAGRKAVAPLICGIDVIHHEDAADGLLLEPFTGIPGVHPGRFRKLGRRGVSVARFLLQTFHANRFQRARNFRTMPRWRNGIFRNHTHGDRGLALLRHERRTAREHLV